MILPTCRSPSAFEPLDLAADQGGGRPGVLGVGIPRPPGQLGGDVGIPLGNEECLRHARGSYA